LEDLDVNEMIILKYILKTYDLSESGQGQYFALVNTEMYLHVTQMAGENLE
jgi:hypothetical protein